MIFLCFCFSIIEAQSLKLPNECRKILDRNFRGWKLLKVSKEISEYHKKARHPFDPNFIKGDWNGDGKTDYAVLIKVKNQNKTIAFVRSRRSFKYYSLEGGDYIQVFKKGMKDYNYDAQKDFAYKNDSIFVGAGDCCGSSYIWQKGKFVGIVTSD